MYGVKVLCRFVKPFAGGCIVLYPAGVVVGVDFVGGLCCGVSPGCPVVDLSAYFHGVYAESALFCGVCDHVFVDCLELISVGEVRHELEEVVVPYGRGFSWDWR